MRYILVKQDGRERDVTALVKLNGNSIQKFYHKFKLNFVFDYGTVKLYKETQTGRELIYNIP